MAVLSTDFLVNRKNKSRSKGFVLASVGLVLLVAVSAAGFHFYQKNGQGKGQPTKVAGAQTVGVLPKEWLLKYFGTDDVNDAKIGGVDGDPDGDILTNQQEYLFGTDPTKADTDGDGVIDGEEVAFGSNPNGAGDMQLTDEVKNYAKQVIATDKTYENYSEEKITQQVEKVLQPDREVVLDLPADAELTVTQENSKDAFEAYYNQIIGINSGEQSELQDIQDRLFSDMTSDEIDSYTKKLQITEDLVKKIPVPSELLEAHKLRIAGIRSGVRLLELVRNNYHPEAFDQQFWSDVFYQGLIAQEANLLELNEWGKVLTKLKDMGGI